MPNPSDQPSPYDAVLGGQNRPDPYAAVLGGNSQSLIQPEIVEAAVKAIEGISQEIINENNKETDVIQEEKQTTSLTKESKKSIDNDEKKPEKPMSLWEWIGASIGIVIGIPLIIFICAIALVIVVGLALVAAYLLLYVAAFALGIFILWLGFRCLFNRDGD